MSRFLSKRGRLGGTSESCFPPLLCTLNFSAATFWILIMVSISFVSEQRTEKCEEEKKIMLRTNKYLLSCGDVDSCVHRPRRPETASRDPQLNITQQVFVSS